MVNWEENLIPPRDQIEPFYEEEELEIFDQIRGSFNAIPDPKARNKMGRELLRKMWPDEVTYISKTHWIRTKGAQMALLQPNYAQRRFYEDVILTCRKENRPVRGIILKARQLGFSTFIQALQYEWADNHSNRSGLTLSYDRDSTAGLFDKSTVIHSKMWFPRPTRRQSGQNLAFSDNGSQISIRTSGNLSAGRGDTYQHVHCSEVPMWADPEETLTGLSQAVPDTPDSTFFHESTAKGAAGPFYDLWCAAEDGENDFVPFFCPWYWDPTYSRDFATPRERKAFLDSLSVADRRYMERYSLSAEQMAWRRWTIRNKCEGSVRKFQQEYPACSEEAFLTTGSPVFNQEKLLELERYAQLPSWKGELVLPRQTNTEENEYV